MLLPGLRSLYALPVTLILVEVSTNVALFSRVQYEYEWCDLCISHREADCLTVNPINDSDIVLLSKFASSFDSVK
jgi:hypothetical protein